MLTKLLNPIIDRITDRIAKVVVAELTKQLPGIAEAAVRGVTDEVLDRLIGDSRESLAGQVAAAVNDALDGIYAALPWPLGGKR
ncbi:hypothetical protein ABQE69_08950 [Mycolicibacillus trivialis]